MSRRIQVTFAIVIVILIDGIAWWKSYIVHTELSPEESRIASEILVGYQPSLVKPRQDNYYQTISLNGEWEYKQTGSEIGEYPSPSLDTSKWHKMNIPQNWYLEGLNYHGVMWFRKNFSTDPGWQGRSIQLHFGGIDYYADVWLNGKKLGHHEGYFQPISFDITDHLNYVDENFLVVRVESPYEDYKTVWPYKKSLIKGVFSHSAFHPGDPWSSTGQEYNTGGIWNDVNLLISDFLSISDIQIQATWPTSQTIGINPKVFTSLTIDNYADTTIEAEVKLTFIPLNHSGNNISLPTKSLTLTRGQRTFDLIGIAEDPRLWWSWDRGEPNLYTAQVEIVSGSKTLVQKGIIFGFRQIIITDEWQFYLNGERFFPRGSNYISSIWLSETDSEWFVRDGNLIRDGNLNFIRLPAHVEPPEFYETMDKIGILVWQDFPLQWGYSDAPAFIDEAQRQLSEMINMLYNHPSIAVWCMHNEGPSDASWLAEVDNNYDPSQNRRLDNLLYNQAISLDPNRRVHKNSGFGDSHVNIGWNSGKWTNFGNWSIEGASNSIPDLEASSSPNNFPGAPFVTEFGAQGLPNKDMMSGIFSPEELIYSSGEVRDRWEFHNFQPAETFNITKINTGESIDDFIQNSQTYQANLIKFAIENYRRAKYHPMEGIFYGMFADPWPSISFAVLDYERKPKLGYKSLQSAMQPVLPSIFPSKPVGLEGVSWVYEDQEDFMTALWVVNDTNETFSNAKLSWQIETDSGQRVTFGEIRVDVAPDSSKRFWTVPTDSISVGAFKIEVTLSTQDGLVLGENDFSFIILPNVEETLDLP
jgi:beta-mannosidase